MKIILADHFGICFGVRDAIAQAERLADAGPITILGELVHNPVVRERLRARGVNEHPLEQTTTQVSPAVMVTAHGASDLRRAAWKGAGYTIADGTCPLVRHAHTQLHELVRAGFFPVVIGRPGHVEVRGLTEDFPGATVIEKRRIGSALGRLIAEAEVIVVVGGLTSNNTRQLAASCRAAGRRAIHIERPEDLRPADFLGVNVVGLTAGTSTLTETVEAVHMRLRTFAA